MEVINKIFTGVVTENFDKLHPSKISVSIPELADDEIFFVDNALNTYHISRDKNGMVKEQGSYMTLLPGTEVKISFMTNDLDSGYVFKISSFSSYVPTNKHTQKYFLIMTTPNGSKIDIDDDKNRMHLTMANGSTDILLDEDSITLQTSDTTGTTPKWISKMEVSNSGIYFNFKDKTMLLNDTGFNVNLGPETPTAFSMTKKGSVLTGAQFLNISSPQGRIDVYGQNTNIQGEGELNLLGSISNITGKTKMALNGGVVHIDSFLGTHIKSKMDVNIDALLKIKLQSLMYDRTTLGMSNTFAIVSNITNQVSSETSQFKAEAITTSAFDGMRIKGLGVATSVATSMGLSIMVSMQSIELGIAIFGTIMSFDTIVSAIIGDVVTQNLIADTAAPAITTTSSVMGLFQKDQITESSFIDKINKTEYLVTKDKQLNIPKSRLIKV